MVPLYAAFYAGLNERGWVEGRNLLIEGRWVAGRAERFADFAAELVALDVEVIVVFGGSQATQAAQQATSKIPIVFSSISNPIEFGFITSFARPGGNVTGVSNQLGDLAVEKFVELLRAFAPHLERVGLIWQPANSGSAQGRKDLDAAKLRGRGSVCGWPSGADPSACSRTRGAQPGCDRGGHGPSRHCR